MPQCSTAALDALTCSFGRRARTHLVARVLQIQSALSRQRKEETVEVLEGLLQKSAVVVGLRYQGLTVKQLQDFRRSLPQDSKMLVRCAGGSVWQATGEKGRVC